MPTISAGDLTKLRDQSPYNAIVEWFLAVAPYGDPVFTARVNDPGNTIDDPNMTIPFDSGVGSIEAGMTLWVGSTSEGRDIGTVRVRADESGATGNLDVAENYDIDWADDLYLTAPGEGGFREIWSKYQRLESDGTVKKDYDIAYGSAGDTGDPGENIPPKANAGPPCPKWLGTGGYVDIDFIAEDRYEVGSGETLTTYTWDFKDGVVQSWGAPDPDSGAVHMGNAANPNVVRFSSTGFRYVQLDIECSNGETGTVYIPVWTFDEGTVDPIKVIEMRGQEGSIDGGWTATIAVRDTDQDVIYDFPEGALVVLFTRTWYGGNEDDIGGYHDRENVRMVGWIDEETFVFNHETGEVEFQIINHDQRLRRLFGFGFTVQDTDSPDEWHEVKNLNVDRAVQWHHTWHTTVNEVCHVQKAGEGSDRAFYEWRAAETNLFDQVQTELANDANYFFMSDRQGILRITRDPQYLLVASRDAAICSLVQSDWRNQITARRASKPVGYVKIGGWIPGGTSADYAKLAWAPGDAPVQAADEIGQEGYIIQDVDELKQWAGMMLANKNNPFPEVTIELRGYWSVFDPAFQEFIELTADDPHDRRDWSAQRFIVRRVAYHDRSDDSTTVTELVLEMETDGPPGVEKEIPDLPPIPDDPPTPDPPPPPPPPPIDPPYIEGVGMAIAYNDSQIGWTAGILPVGGGGWGGAGPTWVDVSGSLTGHILDIRYVQYGDDQVGAFLLTNNRVYWASDVLTSSITWVEKLTLAEAITKIDNAGGHTSNGSFWFVSMDTIATSPGFAVVSISNDYLVNREGWSIATTDYGENWYVGEFEDEWTIGLEGIHSGTCQAPVRGMTVDQNTGDIYAFRYTQSYSDSYSVWREENKDAIWKSTDKAVSWARITGPVIKIDDEEYAIPLRSALMNPSVMFAVQNAQDEVLRTTDGGSTWVDVRPAGYHVNAFGDGDKEAGHIENWTFDADLWWLTATGYLLETTDGGDNWTELAHISTYCSDLGGNFRSWVGGWPGNKELIWWVSGSRDDSSGSPPVETRLLYSDDGGDTFYSLMGNWGDIFGDIWEGDWDRFSSMLNFGIVPFPRIGANAE